MSPDVCLQKMYPLSDKLMVEKQTFIPSFSMATAEESKLEIKGLLMQRESDLCRKVFSGVNYNSLLPVQTV